MKKVNGYVLGGLFAAVLVLAGIAFSRPEAFNFGIPERRVEMRREVGDKLFRPLNETALSIHSVMAHGYTYPKREELVRLRRALEDASKALDEFESSGRSSQRLSKK